MEVDRALYQKLRRRMLLFYFLAGINLFMGFAVITAGPGRVPSGTLTGMVLIFLVFAVVNIYMARMLKKQWDQHLKQLQGGGDRVSE